MRFEAGRVIQLGESLADSRFAGNGGQNRALAFIADRFQSFNWRARRSEPIGGRFRDRSSLVVAHPDVTSTAAVRVVFEAQLQVATTPDNRTASEYSGPAFLLELARTWPASRQEVAQAICAVSVKPRFGRGNVRELIRSIEQEREQKPTLLLTVLRPGLGQELIIGGRQMRHLAEAAASDLWIPYRTSASHPFSFFPLSWPFGHRLESHITILGSTVPKGEPLRLDAGAIDRTAQLCAEIVLRWARRHQGVPPREVENRTASRSSQNPG